jgi:site-specific recombinase XerD
MEVEKEVAMLAFNEPISRNILTLSYLRSHVENGSGSIQSGATPAGIPAPLLPPQPQTQSVPEDDRRHGFHQVLKRLGESDLPEREPVEQYLHHMYRKHCQIITITRSFETIQWFMNFLQGRGRPMFAEVSRKDLEAFIEREQDRGLKITSVRLKLATLSTFFRFLIEAGVMQEEVLAKKIRLKLPALLPRAMEPEHLRHLLSVIIPTRDRALILLLVRTGMRIGELLETRLSAINLTEQKILIYQARKTGMGRVVYFSADARDALQQWLEIRDPGAAYLFYGRRRKRLTYAAAREVFKKWVEKAGLVEYGYSLHRLRHSFASELLNAGMRLECLQPLLGHTTIEVTRRYARLTDKNREEEYFRAMTLIERGEIDGHY